MTETGEVRELIIIGGGPAGYTAALYAARGNLRPLVFEGFKFGDGAVVAPRPPMPDELPVAPVPAALPPVSPPVPPPAPPAWANA